MNAPFPVSQYFFVKIIVNSEKPFDHVDISEALTFTGTLNILFRTPTSRITGTNFPLIFP